MLNQAAEAKGQQRLGGRVLTGAAMNQETKGGTFKLRRPLLTLLPLN